MKDLSKLALCSVREFGVDFKTGKPVKFKAIHNTTKAPNFGPIFGQDIEPSGRYVLHKIPTSKPRVDQTVSVVAFKNPLVLQLSTDGDTYGPKGWKARLRRELKAKKKALSCKLKRLTFDGIITCENGETREIVDLRPVVCKR
jgi:hypothetical protein